MGQNAMQYTEENLSVESTKADAKAAQPVTEQKVEEEPPETEKLTIEVCRRPVGNIWKSVGFSWKWSWKSAIVTNVKPCSIADRNDLWRGMKVVALNNKSTNGYTWLEIQE